MKKRILALALAGTTAFSVFGAAISANAWSWPSTDTVHQVDAYQTYTPVAKKIAVTKTATTDLDEYTVTYGGKKTTVYVDEAAEKFYTTTVNKVPVTVYPSIEDYKIATFGEKQEVYTIVPTSADDALANLGNCQPINLVSVAVGGKTYIRYANVDNDVYTNWESQGSVIKLDGPFYVSNGDWKTATADTDVNGELGTNTIIYYDENVVSEEEQGLIQNLSTYGNDPAKGNYRPYKVNPANDYVKLTVQNGEIVEADKKAEGDIKVENALKVLSVDVLNGGYNYNGSPYTNISDLIDVLVKGITPSIQYVNGDKTTLDTDIIVDTTVNSNSILVWDNTDTDDKDETQAKSHSEWYFNGDLTGDVTVEPYKVSTNMGNDNIPNVTKTPNETIYAYDFLSFQPTVGSAGAIATAWNYGTTTDAANALLPYGTTDKTGTNVLNAETGRGNTNWGIRYSVVSEWIDFLDELAINKDNTYYNDRYFVGYYNESWDEFRENYTDMFYSDAYYNPWTGQQIGSVNVDLYNIKGLLKDIWKYSGEEASSYDNSPHVVGWENANTSELIYLMQQYDKYIGNYVDKTEVASDEWGDLLLSVLDAATEADFKNANEYRLYANRVESLRTAYETATTVGMIKNAEEEMYDLLVSANNEYRAASTAPSKTDLSATLNGLYFNTSSAPTTYKVAPSTTNDLAHVKYTNYNYLVAAVTGGSSTEKNELRFSSTLTKGYYSLYPMEDYIDDDTTTPNEVYAGNTTSADYAGEGKTKYYATEEYEWFWNVYQLAARMNASGRGTDGNTKQGSVDAVNDALADAVAELTVTTTPSSMDVGAMNDAVEEYAGKIESDYDAGYYAKYVQANDYAENVAEGKWQTRIAAMINGVAGEALTYQGTQVTVTKNDMKTVETAIKNGKTALEAIKADKDYNAAQVNALNEALDNAEDLVSLYEGTYSTKRDDQSVNKNYSRLVGDKDQMVKSDLTAAIEAIDAAINYSEVKLGWNEFDEGWKYGYEKADGTLAYVESGWYKVGASWFYFRDSIALENEWIKEDGKWYYLNSNCAAAYGWAKVDGKWYYFNGDNSMRTGWVKTEGNWYYLNAGGAMVTGWAQIDGKWYYFNKNENAIGQMMYSTTVDGYKLDANGVWVK